MSKRRPAAKSKHSLGPKIAAKAQRVAQTVVRSPKGSRLPSAGTASTESHPERHSEEEALGGDPMTAFHETRLEPATALQDEPNYDPTKGSDFSSAAANVRAIQAKLLEVAQADMQFAFEFAERLATMRSPVEFLSVTAEFTSKRSAMFLKHSKEIAELSISWRTAL
ncbi:phasin family protein [Bradyrhizobium sp. 157]|nr:phasin family protein [Bradyrhizobium sp. 157]